MEKEFIPYEQALALKELGFDEPCLMFYRGNDKELVYAEYYGRFKNSSYVDKTTVSSPLYQQAFRWFREKYNLHCNIDPWGYCIFDDNRTEKTGFKTYEEAELACLIKLIELCKKN